jgi:hypothetical protein
MIPTKWVIGASIALVLMVIGAFVFGGPIVSFLQGQVKSWQAKEETAQDTAVSNGAEADGQAALGTAQGQIAEQVIERHTETIRYVEKASAAPDAKAPLGYDRSQRVADHTASLCQQRPAVCARGASPEGSDPGVR